MARGSIKQRGSVWYIIVPHRAPDGSYKRKWTRAQALGYPNTERGAEAALAKQITDVNQGKSIDPSKVTVAAFMDLWQSGRLHVRGSTRYKDSINIRAYIVPQLGHVELRRLTRTMVRAWHATLLERLQANTISRIHQTLVTALNAAVEDGVIRENVAARVRPPKVERRDPTVWNIAQIETFLAACEDDPYGVLWSLVVMTGMRRGEALALQWSDVDLAAARLTVRRTLTSDSNGKRTVGPPKTASSFRTIDLAASTMRSLQSHRDTQRFLANSPLWVDSGLVFAKGDGSMLRPSTLVRALDALISRTGLPRITLHGLRHTHATWMILAGTNPKIVSERLGHSRIGITLDLYTHVLPNMQRDAANRLDETLGSKSESSGTTDVGD